MKYLFTDNTVSLETIINLLITSITPSKILWFLLIVLCVWFIVELYIILIEKIKMKNWYPGINNIHFNIYTTAEKYQMTAQVLKEKDQPNLYAVEYREVISGDIKKREVLTENQFMDIAFYNSITRRISVIKLYAITPDERVMKCEITRTNENNELYEPYTEEDISKQLLEIASQHLHRLALRTVKKTDKTARYKYLLDIKTVKKLPVRAFEEIEEKKKARNKYHNLEQ